ncbi:MAG: hypothetical protein P4L59_19675 [Desulfosporosinus sp.]|nr:hypothetical protein [Desulfosporosinus sp.]
MRRVETFLNEEKEYRVGKKETWLLDTSFEWFRGHAEINGELVTLTDISPYELRDINTWKAFKELASCISNPGLIYNPAKLRDYGKYFDQDKDRKWIYFLHPKSKLGDQDLQNLLNWISKYGFLYPDATPYRNRVKLDKSSRMKLDDIIVQANLISLAWKLFESSRTKDGKVIRELVNIISMYNFREDTNNKSFFITFGLTELAPEAMSNRIRGTEEPNIDNWSQETMRKSINLWIGRVSKYFIDVKIENRFTQEIRIRPVLTASSFSSWLWLHFLTHISEVEGTPNAKVCRECGVEYSGSRSVRCKACNLKHRNNLKYKSAKEGVLRRK